MGKEAVVAVRLATNAISSTGIPEAPVAAGALVRIQTRNSLAQSH